MEGPYLSNVTTRSFNKKELVNLKNGITKLDKNEYLEILKILKRNGNKLTENKNGIFINLNNISNEILTEIDNFVKYSFDNHERLAKLEYLSDKLFKDSLSINKYDKYRISKPSLSLENNFNNTLNSGVIKQMGDNLIDKNSNNDNSGLNNNPKTNKDNHDDNSDNCDDRDDSDDSDDNNDIDEDDGYDERAVDDNYN